MLIFNRFKGIWMTNKREKNSKLAKCIIYRYSVHYVPEYLSIIVMISNFENLYEVNSNI